MRIVFFELEGWEETLLKETSFDGHALELSTRPLAERTPGGRQEAEVVSVFTHSPLNHSLLNLDSVVITSRIAFSSREAVQRTLEETGENIRAFLGGHCGTWSGTRISGQRLSLPGSRIWTNCQPKRPLTQRWPRVTSLSKGEVTLTIFPSWTWRVVVHPTPQYGQIVSVWVCLDSSQVPDWRISYSLANISAPVGQTPMQFPQ